MRPSFIIHCSSLILAGVPEDSIDVPFHPKAILENSDQFTPNTLFGRQMRSSFIAHGDRYISPNRPRWWVILDEREPCVCGCLNIDSRLMRPLGARLSLYSNHTSLAPLLSTPYRLYHTIHPPNHDHSISFAPPRGAAASGSREATPGIPECC